MNLHYEMVTDNLKEVLIELMKIESLTNFRLVGGTSLALQLGHRASVDIDLFAAGGVLRPRELAENLNQKFGKDFKIIHILQYGLTALFGNIKVDLYDWKVPFVYDQVIIDGIRLASIEDIFAFKCETILDRKAEKDFVDIAEIVRHRPLDLLLSTFQKRYPQYYKVAVLAILLKTEVFARDHSIRYASGKSWETYRENLVRSIVEYEKELQMKKEIELKKRNEKIQTLIDQKRNKKT